MVKSGSNDACGFVVKAVDSTDLTKEIAKSLMMITPRVSSIFSTGKGTTGSGQWKTKGCVIDADGSVKYDLVCNIDRLSVDFPDKLTELVRAYWWRAITIGNNDEIAPPNPLTMALISDFANMGKLSIILPRVKLSWILRASTAKKTMAIATMTNVKTTFAFSDIGISAISFRGISSLSSSEEDLKEIGKSNSADTVDTKCTS